MPESVKRGSWLLPIVVLSASLLCASPFNGSSLHVSNDLVLCVYALPGLLWLSSSLLLAGPRIVRGNLAVLLSLILLVETVFALVPRQDGPKATVVVDVEGVGG